MKLNRDFITHQSDGEHITVSVGSAFSGLVQSNQTAGFIVECLKEETTEEQIVDKMLEKYDAPREVIASDVANIIERLRSIGAIDE